MPKRPAAKSREQSREETRQKLLDAGYDLLREMPVLDHVQVQHAAFRAGLSSGALYYHWPDGQEAYRLAVLDHAFKVESPQLLRAVEGAVTTARQQGAGLEETVRAAAVADFDQVTDRTSLPVLLAAVASVSGEQEESELRKCLRGRYEALSEKLVPILEQMLTAHSRKPRPPFTIEMIVTTLIALVEGLFVRWQIDPEAVPDKLPQGSGWLDDMQPEGGRWNMFAVVALALVPAMTAPATPYGTTCGSDQDVRQLVRELRQEAERAAK